MLRVKMWVPNLFTLGNLSLGFFSILLSMGYRVEQTDRTALLTLAGGLILLAALMDGLDGFAARLLNAESELGAQGTGISRGVFWREMGVVNLPGGKPTMELSGKARARLEGMTPSGMKALVHLTITDDYPLAQAFVIIEAVPDNGN